MNDIKSLMQQEFWNEEFEGTQRVDSDIVPAFGAKLSELTLAITIPLIAMMIHESKWSEMMDPTRR